MFFFKLKNIFFISYMFFYKLSQKKKIFLYELGIYEKKYKNKITDKNNNFICNMIIFLSFLKIQPDIKQSKEVGLIK